jgi:creatinine amidohydrolase
MFLYSLTWEEVSKLDRSIVVIIPFGAVEQHSYHLPLGTDSIIAEAIAARLERQMPDRALIVPTNWLGCSKHHMQFAGSLTAEIETFVDLGEQIVCSLAQHAFRNFLLLNAHGGNMTKISIIVEKLSYRMVPRIKVVGVTYWDLIQAEIKQIRETPLGGMGHACELETSLMLAVQPEMVRPDRIEADGPRQISQFEERDMFAPGVISIVKAFEEISQHGGVGDPRTASREKGERILAAVITKLSLVVHEIQGGRL